MSAIDLNEMVASRYDARGPEQLEPMYMPVSTRTRREPAPN
jgi:hypothetical protein